MTRARNTHRGLFAVLVAAVALIAVLGVWRPWATPAATVAGADGVGVASSPERFTLPDDPTVLIFGDSWTYGSAASAPDQGYAYAVAPIAGWNTVVDGVRGSGYLRPGLDGPDFGTRIAALDPAIDPDLVIVQGSINDRRMPEAGYREAVSSAWDRLVAVYPDARIVILGPAPQVLPVEDATARIDRDLAALAAERGWWYISPIAQHWITTQNYLGVIDTSKAGADHPSTRGHAYLALRLAAAVKAIER